MEFFFVLVVAIGFFALGFLSGWQMRTVQPTPPIEHAASAVGSPSPVVPATPIAPATAPLPPIWTQDAVRLALVDLWGKDEALRQAIFQVERERVAHQRKEQGDRAKYPNLAAEAKT